jgi:hypothetical protein
MQTHTVTLNGREYHVALAPASDTCWERESGWHRVRASWTHHVHGELEVRCINTRVLLFDLLVP